MLNCFLLAFALFSEKGASAVTIGYFKKCFQNVCNLFVWIFVLTEKVGALILVQSQHITH